MQRCLAPTTCISFKPTTSAIYSTSLLEALNSNRSAYSIFNRSDSGKLKIRPTLHFLSFKDPSTYNSYVRTRCVAAGDFVVTELGFRSVSSSSLSVSLAKISTTTSPLMAA